MPSYALAKKHSEELLVARKGQEWFELNKESLDREWEQAVEMGLAPDDVEFLMEMERAKLLRGEASGQP